MRNRLQSDKVSKINHVRGILAEDGQVMSKSLQSFMKTVRKVITELEKYPDVSPAIILNFRLSVEEIEASCNRIEAIERDIKELAKHDKNYGRFLTMPGVGPLTASRMCTLLADPTVFEKGR